MRLWLSKNSEVPLREQLVTQIVLGIVSGDLPPGVRLPSTRELALRFTVHPNTVSAAYRELAARGWVEQRQGSGVYVCPPVESTHRTINRELELDNLIRSFLRDARMSGFSLREVRQRVGVWLAVQPPDHLLIVEPDVELRGILIAEIEAAIGLQVRGATEEECLSNADLLTGAIPVFLYGHAEHIRAVLPAGTGCLLLHSRSIAESLRGAESPPRDALIAVVSHWTEFLRWARNILVAAGLNPDALSFRDAREPDWRKGLRATSFVITDTLTANQIPIECPKRVFRIIADASIEDLRNCAERNFAHS